MFRYFGFLTLVIIVLGSSQARSSSQVAFPSFTDWGEPTKLSGSLAKPSGQGPFPAVVMLHACSGMAAANGTRWEKRLLDWGYAVLRVDSFGPRGLKNVCKYEATSSYDEDILDSDSRVEDAHGARQYLATLPYIGKNRIGLIGWAHGGATVLHILAAGPAPGPFDAAIAVYPACGTILMEINAPLLILIGKNDEWSVASICEQLEQPSLGTHKFVRIVYPGAYHQFDEEGADYKILGRRMRYDPAAAADTKKRVRAFLARYLK